MRVEYGTVIKPRVLEVLDSSLQPIYNIATRKRIDLSIEDLEQLNKLGIEVVSENIGNNCFEYVLGQGDIVDKMKRLLEESEVAPEGVGDVIFYINRDLENKNRVVHIGRIDEGKVISKWGQLPVFRHNMDKVPCSYGDKAVILKKRG